jgi:ankyrin repeat protein
VASPDPLPYSASIEEYDEQAVMLLDALHAGDDEAAWKFKWEHPAFRGAHVSAVRDATLGIDDARLVVAAVCGFNSWDDLSLFARTAQADGEVSRFENAVEAVVSGDLETLRSKLAEYPDLVQSRSSRRHRATLLHYIAANGVEGHRQRTPANAVEVAKALLDAGAEVDALADMYEEKCTTMSMLVSSTPPNDAGLQIPLAMTLLDYGAAIEGRGSKWQSPVSTALVFGFVDTARAIAERGAPVDDVIVAAGLGLSDETEAFIARSSKEDLQKALALAAQHGHEDVVRVLLDAGVDPDRYNPDGFHSHSTPLHQAALRGYEWVVRLLIERGARLDLADTIYDSTPAGWARHGGHKELARLLDHGAEPS